MTSGIQERQQQVRELAHPHIEHLFTDLLAAGIQPHEAAQAMILEGTGILVGAFGPNGAGNALRQVGENLAAWISHLADAAEAQQGAK